MKTKLIAIIFITFILMTGAAFAQADEEAVENRQFFETDEAANVVNIPTFSHGERRESNPFQIQLVHAFGPATPQSFAPGGGLHLGYQVSKLFYLGLTSTAFVDGKNTWDKHRNYRYDDDDDEYEEKIYGQDGATFIESELDPMHLLELRINPWDFGLYFSLGAMYRGKQKSTVEFRQEVRTIGDNDYDSGLEATVEYKDWYSAAAGIGFNYIFKCGFTLGTSMTFGLNAQTPDVTVTSTTIAAAVTEDDLEHWKKQIETNEKQLPYLYTFNLGYAF